MSGSHPRDQWFRIYTYTPGVAGPIINAKTKEVEVGWVVPPKWELVDTTLHVHHPDYYHPDPHVAIAFHRKTPTRRTPAACGLEHNVRVRFVETHDPKDRCPDCVKVTEAAKVEHERIHAERVARAALAELEKKE